MKGTEKQIAWANKIKADVMKSLNSMSNTSMQSQYAAFYAWLDSKDSAEWWIVNWKLTMTANMFLRCVMREYRSSAERT